MLAKLLLNMSSSEIDFIITVIIIIIISEVITMSIRTEKKKLKKTNNNTRTRSNARLNTKNHRATQNKNYTRTVVLERSVIKHFYCRQISTLGPDAILNTKVYKMFGSHNGSLTRSMHHSENIKIKLITMIKQRRALLANTTSRIKKMSITLKPLGIV